MPTDAVDYMSGNPDGTLSDKSGFLARVARRADGSEQLGRHTDLWQRRDGRWLCVAAQFGLQPPGPANR